MIKNKYFRIQSDDNFTIVNGCKQYNKFKLFQILSDGTEIFIMDNWTLGSLMNFKKLVESKNN